MLDVDDIVALARRWLAGGHGVLPGHYDHNPRARQQFAPLLVEALRNGPLDNETMADALDECTATGDDTAAHLVAQLLTLTESDRELVGMRIAEGWQA